MFVDDCGSLDLAALRSPELGVADYTATWTDGTKTTGRIMLTTTVPHFGGVRYWYVCPDCRRRVAKLYPFDEDRQFRCRLCRELVYEIQHRKGGRMAFWRPIRRYVREMNGIKPPGGRLDPSGAWFGGLLRW